MASSTYKGTVMEVEASEFEIGEIIS